MALTLSQIVKDEKNFKGKSIAEIDYSFQILDIFLSLTDGEWTISAELFNQGHGSVLQYSPVWLYMHTCHGWLPLQLVSWGKAQLLYYTKHCNELYNT